MKFDPKLYKLSNGVCVVLDNMDIETAFVQINFFTGSRDENPNEYGITHFVEHMLCKETTNFSSEKQRRDYLQNKGGYVNADTSTQEIRLYGRIIAENLPLLLDVLADQINNKLFVPETIEREKSIVINELNRYMSNNDERLSSFFDKTLFNVYVPNGEVTLGNVETIKSFNQKQLFEFFDRRFSGQNCIITVSGKIIDEKDTLAQIEKLFSGLSNHKVSENSDLTYCPTVAHNSDIQKETDYLAIVFPDLRENTYENRLQNMAMGFFEQYLSQELLNTVRFENGLVYDIGTDTFGNEKFGLNGIATQTTPEQIGDVVSIIAKTCYDVYNKKQITEEELQRYKNFVKLPRADFLESSSSRARRITNYWHNYHRLYDYYKSTSEADSITLQNVLDASRGFFDGEMSIITQGANFDADLKKIWIDNFK